MTSAGLNHRYLVRNFVDQSTAAAAWTPASISGVVEGWDMSDTAKITASSNRVSQVNGQLGFYNMVQATGANQCLTNSTQINSLNTLNFDSTACSMASTPSNGASGVAQPYTFLVVYKAGGTNGRILDTSIGGRFVWDVAANYAMFAGASLNDGAATTNAEQAVIVVNGASSQYWVNNVSKASGNAGANTTGATINLTGGGATYVGLLAELWYVNGAISAGDQASWNTYCAKWGL